MAAEMAAVDTSGVPTVQPGMFVVFETTKGPKLVKMKATNNTVFNGKINADIVLGRPFDVRYVQTSTALREPTEEEQRLIFGDAYLPEMNVKDITGNNQEIVDRPKQNQELTAEAIVAMRDDDEQMTEVINALVQGNKSFDQKTQMSKEKYLKRKRSKHLRSVCVRQPTLHTLSPCFADDKLGYLRSDLVSYLLCQANIHAGQRVLVWDATCGHISGAVAQRMGGYGEIHQVSFNPNDPRTHMFDHYNPTPAMRERFHSINLADMAYVNRGLLPVKSDPMKMLPRESCDAIIIVPRYGDLEASIRETLPWAKAGARIVVGYNFIQKLVDTIDFFRSNYLCTDVTLAEIFSREIQVLPARTHPTVMMHGASGFVCATTFHAMRDKAKEAWNIAEEDLLEPAPLAADVTAARLANLKKEEAAAEAVVGEVAAGVGVGVGGDDDDQPAKRPRLLGE